MCNMTMLHLSLETSAATPHPLPHLTLGDGATMVLAGIPNPPKYGFCHAPHRSFSCLLTRQTPNGPESSWLISSLPSGWDDLPDPDLPGKHLTGF